MAADILYLRRMAKARRVSPGGSTYIPDKERPDVLFAIRCEREVRDSVRAYCERENITHGDFLDRALSALAEKKP